MRHNKHRAILGVKKEHRSALMANLASHLFLHGKIQTTLAKAKALRPFAEKVITMAKKAASSESVARKIHLRRLAIARVRDEVAVKKLFEDGVVPFMGRHGGYTRISKLMPRVGDAAPLAFIQYVDATIQKSGGRRRRRKSTAVGKTVANPKNPTPTVPVNGPPSGKKTEELTPGNA
jgi:large subunit ribosomal protein L17